MKKYLIVHGHFYQPPRENPWIEKIESQSSAFPAHDWNERINSECYYPNGNCRIRDASNHIVDIVNNYKNISFNFGPTLLSWMQVYAPATYELILKADAESVALHNGHGAAIAQCYNHIIMPLATQRDQRTQIRWGVADFRRRFKRQPESIWLPETAINQTTLNILTEFKFKYIILSPYQAERVRLLKGDKRTWKGVQKGDIDIRRPYRCFATDATGKKLDDRYINIFFYHGELSRAISFEHLLRSATQFVERIEAAYGTDNNGQLVSVATDGETYGHHERFGDMGLAYMLNMEAPVRDITPTNFAALLESVPVEWEVELKPGAAGEGTAWSCAHGVGRWYRNCGCSTGGQPGWNQEWRQPLRDALNELNAQLAEICLKVSEHVFHDLWEARDDYINVILNRSDESLEEFFNKHIKDRSQSNIEQKALHLMEIQRNAQLMFTSCGWFFTELSGLETVQILKYAARAIEIAYPYSDGLLEQRFINNLAKAKSNISEYGNGAWIYNNFVLPSRVSFGKIVTHYAIASMYDALQDDKKIYVYDVEEKFRHSVNFNSKEILFGRVKLTSQITRDSGEFIYALINRERGEYLDCLVHEESNDGWNFEFAKSQLVKNLESSDAIAINEIARKIWRGQNYMLVDMLEEERKKIVDKILGMQLKDTYNIYEKIYEENYGLMRMIARSALKLPDELILPTKITFTRIIHDEIENFDIDEPLTNFQRSINAAELAEKLNLQLELSDAIAVFQALFEKVIHKLYTDFSSEMVRKLEMLTQVSDKLRLNLHKTPIQNALFLLLRQRVLPEIEKISNETNSQDKYNVIAGILRVAFNFNFNIKIYKDRLKTYEKQFSQDPDYWP